MTSKEVIDLFEIKSGNRISYDQLRQTMKKLKIYFKSRIVNGMKITSYLDKNDISQLAGEFSIVLYDKLTKCKETGKWIQERV